jgi:hypothetical protein
MRFYTGWYNCCHCVGPLGWFEHIECDGLAGLPRADSAAYCFGQKPVPQKGVVQALIEQ